MPATPPRPPMPGPGQGPERPEGYSGFPPPVFMEGHNPNEPAPVRYHGVEDADHVVWPDGHSHPTIIHDETALKNALFEMGIENNGMRPDHLLPEPTKTGRIASILGRLRRSRT